MAKFKLAIALHNHQPVGNFEAVFEEAHQKAYLPFLKLVSETRNFRFSLHQSGILWRFQEKTHADYFQIVGDLVDNGQIELMTGGFYEPILCSIPESDARGQIAKLNDYIKEHFGVEPEGLWLTERIWEPHLPKVLAQAGVKYLPVDDTHFAYAGLELEQLTGPFVTENEGYRIILLPIQKKLRYLIPFGTVDEVITELKRQAERDSSGLAVYADDGEKFGVWPKTHEHCYRDGWLQKFFEALDENSDWLEVIPLAEAARQKPVGRAYLPSASYAEMLHWALPPVAFLEYERFEKWLTEENQLKRYGRFVRGGHWRGFLAKYDESNLMHKKMLSVSNKLAEYEEKHPDDSKTLETARDRLYAGQCNCPYWHGVFGGLYLSHIRQAVYACLIEADSILNKLNRKSGASLAVSDYDADGCDEVIYTGEAHTAVFKPGRGGTLLDLALNKHNFDITDTLTRRREGYHLKLDSAVTDSSNVKGTTSIHDLILAKEEGLKDYLTDDWYLKRCFIDHFFTNDVDFDRFRSARYGEEGDFIIEPYAFETNRDTNEVTMTRDGHLWRPKGVIPIRIVKRFAFDSANDRIEIRYEITTDADEEVGITFGIENNFNFQAGHAEDRYILIDNHRHENSYLDSHSRYEHRHSFSMIDEYRGLAVALISDQSCELWHCPILTVSLSEGGFEKVYQGTTFVNVYHAVVSGKPFVLNLTLYAGALENLRNGIQKASVVNSSQV
ncbi:MAG: alpha-amylase/4-alpha-glucanotransferase domain-containing protein [candidate division Zixibacteria bacterium]|nr:alpha-amylase/4-alpha-glucanotransferase domain-containing protein [candidate division Zixibacteria bacterium]